jgi:hypothetical protein
MKIKLLFLLLFGIFSVNAQITHDLNWQFGALSPTTDLTIDINDTVRWTWNDAFSHTVQNDAGSTETFNSGVMTGNGLTFSYTFDVLGTNPYLCGVHGAGSMSGTITVQTLGIEDFSLKGFSISPNPASYKITLQIPEGLINVKVEVFDVLGKEIYDNVFTEAPINISDWSNGVYFVRVSLDKAVHTKRFIKQ